jgi:hypothetical protein
MHPTVKAARIAGAIYLSMILVAPFCLLYIPNKLIVHGNAGATAENILTHETLFRMSIFGDLIGQIIFICLGVVLYRLFREVNKTWALLMLSFVVASAAICFLNVLNDVAALILIRGGDFLVVFEKKQRDALAMLFLRLYNHGQFMAEIFWGLWLFPLGLLVYRSGFIPRFIGGWLMINCCGWLVLSFAALFFQKSYNALLGYLQPVLFGEMAFMLWLLIKGAKTERSAHPLVVAA